MKTHWLLGHDASSDRRRPMHKGIVLPPPLFNIRESENRRWSPKTEYPKRQQKQVVDVETPLSNGMVENKTKYLLPPRPQTRDTSQSDPWDGNELGWNAAFDGSIPDSLNYTDEGFDGRYHSSSRKSSNNSKLTGREQETSSLTAVDEITKPLIYPDCRGVENLRKFKNRNYESYKRSWSADALDLSKVSLKDWFSNVFGDKINEQVSANIPGAALQTVKENVKEESAV